MVQAVIVIVAVFTAAGIFLSVRGLIRLYQARSAKNALIATAIFLAAPLLIWGAISIADQVSKPIWVYLPAFLLALAWVAGGYVLEVLMRLEIRRKLGNYSRDIPERPPRLALRCALMLVGALAIWAFGAWVGFGRYAILEVAALCAMVFLAAGACYSIWKYRESY